MSQTLDKSKMLKWLDNNIENLKDNTPSHLLVDKETSILLKGAISALTEIRDMINKGKFDK